MTNWSLMLDLFMTTWCFKTWGIHNKRSTDGNGFLSTINYTWTSHEIYIFLKIMLESKPYRICMRQAKIYIIWWWHSFLLDILMMGLLNPWLWCTTLRRMQFHVLQRLIDVSSKVQDWILQRGTILIIQNNSPENCRCQ